jgi:hypothetical protein
LSGLNRYPPFERWRPTITSTLGQM